MNVSNYVRLGPSHTWAEYVLRHIEIESVENAPLQRTFKIEQKTKFQ
jgi:hypothetical protein